jgi:hypothetical protein
MDGVKEKDEVLGVLTARRNAAAAAASRDNIRLIGI